MINDSIIYANSSLGTSRIQSNRYKKVNVVFRESQLSSLHQGSSIGSIKRWKWFLHPLIHLSQSYLLLQCDFCSYRQTSDPLPLRMVLIGQFWLIWTLNQLWGNSDRTLRTYLLFVRAQPFYRILQILVFLALFESLVSWPQSVYSIICTIVQISLLFAVLFDINNSTEWACRHSIRSPLVTYNQNGWCISVQKFQVHLWPIVKPLVS